MEYYVGLDVSLKQTSICVVDQSGSVVREGVANSDPEAISVYVRSKAPGAVRIGLETGPTSTWLWIELKRLGLPVICIDARHAKAVLKMQINKSDRNDAIGIARIMQTGWFKEVHVKDIDSHMVRALLASRALLVKIKRDLENHVRGLLKNLGLVIGRAKFNVFAARVEELIEGRPELIAAIRPLLEARNAVEQQVSELGRDPVGCRINVVRHHHIHHDPAAGRQTCADGVAGFGIELFREPESRSSDVDRNAVVICAVIEHEFAKVGNDAGQFVRQIEIFVREDEADRVDVDDGQSLPETRQPRREISAPAAQDEDVFRSGTGVRP